MNNQVKYYLEHCSTYEYITIMHKWPVLREQTDINSEEYQKALYQLTAYIETVMDRLGLIL